MKSEMKATECTRSLRLERCERQSFSYLFCELVGTYLFTGLPKQAIANMSTKTLRHTQAVTT